MFTLVTTAVLLALSGANDNKQAPVVHADFTRTQDVVYGRAYGTALTMDVFKPKQGANGATVVWVISGGWFSSHDSIRPDNPIVPIRGLIDRGYEVCAVVHRSSPYFNIEHAIEDVTRSIRFIRHQDGNTSSPIGIMGGSAGGHLALIAATTGDDGNPKSKDPVEQTSSRVQAAACFYPPTDFLNYGSEGAKIKQSTVGERFSASFNFLDRTLDQRSLGKLGTTIKPLTDQVTFEKVLGEVSPITHVTPDDAPILIIHGDNDKLVPIQQSETMVTKLTEAGVEASLIRKPGAGHGWIGQDKDNILLIEWMDDHLQ